MYIKPVFLSLILFCIQGIAAPWLTDLDEALAQGNREHKHILVAFLGPDWCASSDLLEEKVLSEGAFTDSLATDMVLVRVNIPENFEQGGLWQEKYQVHKCPTLILLNHSGAEMARTESVSLKPSEYATYIRELVSDFHKVSEFSIKKNLKKCSVNDLKMLYSKAQKLADDHLKQVLLDEGIKADKSPYFLLEQYGQLLAKQSDDRVLLRKVRNKIAARDPQNILGYQREVALLDFEALSKGQKVKKISTVVQPLIEYLNKFGKEDREHAWQLEMKLSQYYFSHNDADEALKHARASWSLAPQSAKDEVTQSIEYLKTYIQ